MATMHERALEELDTRYKISNAPEVFRYLAQHPELEPVLIKAHQQIFKTFGDNSQLRLEPWQDVEETSHQALLIYISSKLEAEVAGDKLDLISKWLSKTIPHSSGKLIFEIDFV